MLKSIIFVVGVVMVLAQVAILFFFWQQLNNKLFPIKLFICSFRQDDSMRAGKIIKLPTCIAVDCASECAVGNSHPCCSTCGTPDCSLVLCKWRACELGEQPNPNICCSCADCSLIDCPQKCDPNNAAHPCCQCQATNSKIYSDIDAMNE